MKMSVREARSNFAQALDAAERGERVTITKNGKAVAELGPPPKQNVRFNWERAEQWRKNNGFDKKYAHVKLDDKWIEEFNDPAWTKEIFGPDYYDDEPLKK